MQINEVLCKSILSKSGLADYCLNCYIGCEHACKYCYARFMIKYTGHKEPWGEFVDVKINAPEILAKETHKKKKGVVFISSVCDGYQPLEAKYKLTRQCLKILLENGFSVSILTKNALLERDLDLLEKYKDKVEIGFTFTSKQEKLCMIFEPKASPIHERLSVLQKAADLKIKTYAFCGPFLPGLSDQEKDIDELFGLLSEIPLSHVYVDRLNRRYGVWDGMAGVLKQFYPGLLEKYRLLLFDLKASQEYSSMLLGKVSALGKKFAMENKIKFCF